MARTYCMRAKDSVTGSLYLWQLSTLDFSGVGYPGPNTATQLLCTGFADDGAGSAALVQTVTSTVLPAQDKTQHRGAFVAPDGANGRNVIDHGRADPREYGALAVTTETTGTCAAGGSAAVTLAAENGHENGSWLLMHGAGPDHGMATPAAPTAVVQGTPGATTWEFQIVAMTRSYGYTAASAVTTVSNAPATLTDNSYTLVAGVMSAYTPGNFIELYPTPVPGAMWYLVYARKNSVGSFSFKGAMIAYPASYYQDVVASFRFVTETTRGVPSGIPSTPPVAARVNALRTQVISGGRTTSLTVKPKPYTAATGTVVEHCATIPFEDAMDAVSGGRFGGRAGGLVKPTLGTYPITADLRVTRSLTLEGTSDSLSSSGVILQPKHGVQFGVDQGNMAPPRQPGELVRVGDRRQIAIHGLQGLNFNYMMYCTAVTSTDGTWGATATGGDPAWNMADGATTTDGEVTWKTNGNSYYTNAFNAQVRGIHLRCSSASAIPAGRAIALKDMRVSWRNYQSPGTGVHWLPGVSVSVNHVVLPTNANRNGKAMVCVVAGTTGGTEPTWSRVNGATVAGDGGVSYVVIDQPLVQGAAFLVTTVCKVRVGVENTCGTSLLVNGDSSRGYSNNDSKFDVRSVTPYAGHGCYVFGSDGQHSDFHVNSKNAGGGIAYGDDSFYGNPATVLVADSTSKLQNTPSVQSAQTAAWLHQCYSESGPVDWNSPGRVQGGAGLTTQYAGNAIYDGLLNSNDAGRRFDIGAAAPYAGNLNIMLGYVGLASTSGAKGSPFTYYQSYGAYNLGATFKRIQRGLNSNNGSLTIPTWEEPQYDSRGFSPAYGLGVRAGAGRYAGSERFYLPVSAVPTLGAFAPGDYLPWALDNRRLGIIATRRGAEGYTSRANSTGYTQGQIVASASGGRLFVCCNGSSTGGNSAGSEPAGMATAAIDTYVTDGAVLWQCVGTVQQSAALRGVPNWSADAITLTDASYLAGSGLAGSDGPNFALVAATANRSIDVLTTGAVAGDGVEFRNDNDVAFTWTLNSGSGGSAVIVLPVNTPCKVRLRYSGTAWTVDSFQLVSSSPRINPIRNVAGTTDTPTAADQATMVTANNAALTTFTLNSMPAGTAIPFYGTGAAGYTFANGTATIETALPSSGAAAQYQRRVAYWRTTTNVSIG